MSKKATYVILHVCVNCKVQKLMLLEGGLRTYNLLGKSSINNVNFTLNKALPVHDKETLYNHVLIMVYHDKVWDNKHIDNMVKIKNGFITAKNLGGVMITQQQMKYNVSATISNLHFYGMQKTAVHIHTDSETFTNILVENCTFVLNKLIYSKFFNSMIVMSISLKTINPTITFLNCKFYQNTDWNSLIATAVSPMQPLPDITNHTVANIILEGCDFMDNAGATIVNILVLVQTLP